MDFFNPYDRDKVAAFQQVLRGPIRGPSDVAANEAAIQEALRGQNAATASNAGGMLTNNVPVGSVPKARAAAEAVMEPGEEYIRKALELFGQPDDYSQAQQYARARAQESDSAMLNALAAQFAGRRFEPVTETYLKRSLAAREPLRFGSTTISADGTVMKDPGASREREAQRLMQLGQFEMTLDDKRKAREEAAAARMDSRAFQESTKLRTELDTRLQKIDAGGSFASSVLTQLSDPSIAEDPVKQVALIMTFGKLLDPQSVVREAEQRMIANARGVFAAVLNYPDRIGRGVMLTPEQLKSMGDVARTLSGGIEQRRSDLFNYYGGLAQRYGIRPEDVLPYNASGWLNLNDPLNLLRPR